MLIAGRGAASSRALPRCPQQRSVAVGGCCFKSVQSLPCRHSISRVGIRSSSKIQTSDSAPSLSAPRPPSRRPQASPDSRTPSAALLREGKTPSLSRALTPRSCPPCALASPPAGTGKNRRPESSCSYTTTRSPRIRIRDGRSRPRPPRGPSTRPSRPRATRLWLARRSTWGGCGTGGTGLRRVSACPHVRMDAISAMSLYLSVSRGDLSFQSF